MTDSYWKKVLSERYDGQDWTKKPSIFAEQVNEYFPTHSKLLELGCGEAQDGIWFAESGLDVLATDNELSALERAKNRKAEHEIRTVDFDVLDLSQPFRYEDKTFDVVYSHLALHYFNQKTTREIFSEIYRVLKPGGLLAFLVNSINDPEYNTGTRLENDFFETEGTKKRYFSTKTVSEFTRDFEVILCDQDGETYKDQVKGVHNLIRFVGRKPE